MARQLDSFDFGSSTQYPWDEWLNGDIWEISSEDVGGNLSRFPSTVRSQAKKRGMKVRTRTVGENLVIQAYTK